MNLASTLTGTSTRSKGSDPMILKKLVQQVGLVFIENYRYKT